jgi:glycerol-3-phosphate acyltransferase PlsY
LLLTGREDHASLAAVGALVGHLYPLWLQFRGGKGVATLFGIMAALHWPSALVYAAVWLSALAVTRYSSVAGMSAALLAPVAAAALDRFDFALLYLGFGLLVFWKHYDNLERLIAGTEPKVGRSPAADGGDAAAG